MQKIKTTLSTYIANKILKDDELILETKDKSTNKSKEFVVKVVKILSDIPRCNGCSIRLDNKQSYKYGTGHYCFDCYLRRKNKNNDSK